MKKLIIILIAVLAISCEKELYEDNLKVQTNEIPVPKFLAKKTIPAGVEIVGGVAKFDDVLSLNNTLENLYIESEEWRNSVFNYAKIQEFDEDQIYDFITTEDITLNEVHEDWENSLAFQSIRQKIETEMEAWLDNEVLDTLNCPDDYFIVDEELRTVINLDNQFAVGDLIYQVLPNWDIIILNSDRIFDIIGEDEGSIDGFTAKSSDPHHKFKKSIKFINKIKKYNRKKLEKMHEKGMIQFCPNIESNNAKDLIGEYRKNHRMTDFFHFYDNETEIEIEVRIKNGVRNIIGITHFVYAQTKLYKKTYNWFGNGCYRKAYYSQTVSSLGQVYDNNRNTYHAGSTSLNGLEACFKARTKRKYNGPTSIKSGEFGSYHIIYGYREYKLINRFKTYFSW